MHDEIDEQQNGIQVLDNSSLAVLNRSEIDMQIATAKRYPRSIKVAMQTATSMATVNEDTAEACMYSLPRGGKPIQGASIRLAEIMASAWGNMRCAARVIGEEDGFIIAQGVAHDLERNVVICKEVRRRITGRNGDRFSEDMVGVTANAACSIALRNSILAVVPKAYTDQVYEEAKKVAVGDAQTLEKRRGAAMQHLMKMGVTPERVFAALGLQGEQDIDLDKLAILRGAVAAIKDGSQTIDEAFPAVQAPTGSAQQPAPGEPKKTKSERVAAKVAPAAQPAPAAAAPAAAPLAPESTTKDHAPSLPAESDIPLACRAKSRYEVTVTYDGAEFVVPAGQVYDRTRIKPTPPKWAEGVGKKAPPAAPAAEPDQDISDLPT